LRNLIRQRPPPGLRVKIRRNFAGKGKKIARIGGFQKFTI